ncbi:MAG: YHS domain-containing protein [Acidimicrobiales bacterium]
MRRPAGGWRTSAPARVFRAGTLYYFCSERCLERFRAEPR